MIKRNRVKLIVSSLLILLPMVFGIVVWDKLPTELATHWGIDGQVDGFAAPWIAVFALPVFLMLMHWFCLFITSKDTKNKDQSQRAFGIIFWIMPLVSIFTSGIIYTSAFGKAIELSMIMPIFLGLMFAIIGNYMPKVKQNHTLGIKIRWTLESESNWNATHRFAGRVWFIGGIAMIFLALLPTKIMFAGVFVIMTPIVAAPVVYSYNYRRNHKDEVLSEGANRLKYSKTAKILSSIAVACILVFVVFLMFTGKITLEYADDSFTVDADFWSSLTVEYNTIDKLEFREELDRGMRTSGFGSAKLLCGKFENDEFGSYTLYSHTGCDAAVVISSDGRILVIGGNNVEETKAIYEKLNEYCK